MGNEQSMSVGIGGGIAGAKLERKLKVLPSWIKDVHDQIKNKTRSSNENENNDSTNDSIRDEGITRDEEKVFLAFASLNQKGFFNALKDCGYPDLSSSPLANFIYQGAASYSTSNGVSISTFHGFVKNAEKTRQLFKSHANKETNTIDQVEHLQEIVTYFFTDKAIQKLFPSIAAAVTKKDVENDEEKEKDEETNGTNSINEEEQTKRRKSENASLMALKALLDEEAFQRYDTNGDGVIDEAEFLAAFLVIQILSNAYVETIAIAGASSDNSSSSLKIGLTQELYPKALEKIGLPNVDKFFQGQFAEAVFRRSDFDNNGVISYGEFIKAGVRFIYPVRHHQRIKSVQGYPGWDMLALQNPSEDILKICQKLQTLQTGDVILMGGVRDEPMGRFLKYSLDTIWSHTAVVVRRSNTDQLQGIPNENTEQFLQQFPFRRAAHVFCSPGYCRCYDTSPEDFPPSKVFCGLADLAMLESTGEGIHLYDLAYRLLESKKVWSSIAVARLVCDNDNDNNRNDGTKINEFIKSVRGGIYSVAKDELKGAITYHRENSCATDDDDDYDNSDSARATASLPMGSRETDDFCASLVARLYHHMGWMDTSRPSNSFMPNDFDMSTATTEFNEPIPLVSGYSLAPVELILCPDLPKVQLPLKKPRPKK